MIRISKQYAPESLKCWSNLLLSARRKISGKSKKWKSIFNLGRSVDSKGKLSRNGSVFIRAQGMTGEFSSHAK